MMIKSTPTKRPVIAAVEKNKGDKVSNSRKDTIKQEGNHTLSYSFIFFLWNKEDSTFIISWIKDGVFSFTKV